MGKINLSRVILGGIVAGIVIDVFEGILHGAILASQWAEVLAGLGKSGTMSAKQIVAFNVWGLAVGILTVGLYAAIRPRFGAGPKTATCAAIVMWIASALLPNLSMMWATGLFGRRLTLYSTLGALLEMLVGTLVGAALYKEPQLAPAPVATAKVGQTAQA